MLTVLLKRSQTVTRSTTFMTFKLGTYVNILIYNNRPNSSVYSIIILTLINIDENKNIIAYQ